MAYDGSLVFDTKIDSKGFKDGLGKLGKVAGTALKGTGKLIAGAGAAIAAIGTASLKASIDFESAFAGVRKTVNASEKEFAALEKGIRDMSKRIPQSASAIAEVAEAAGQLGIKTDNILGFTETMLMLGDATNMSSDQAATALARLANITRMPQTEFDRLGSTIVALGNNLATTESEIVEMGLRLAGTGAQVGMTEDQILALAGAMSSVGINAEAGGSSMSRVMQKINTEVLSSGKNLQKFAEIAGMSGEEFSKTWREKPQEAILAFVKGLDEINKSGGDVTSTLKELGINSVQEIDTLLRLSGASDVLTDALEMSAKAWEENTALADEASQRYETTESMIQILKNNIDDLAISVGDGLKESFRGGIGTAIEMVQQLADAFEAGGIAGLVEEIGTVLADVAVKITEFAPTMLEAASNMILSFVEGIRSNQETIGLAAVDLIQGFIMTMLEIIPEVLVLGIELITTFIQGIAESIPELIPVAIGAIDTILNALMENLPLILDAGVQIIIALVQGIAENLPNLMTQAIDLVILVADKIIENIPLIISAGLEVLMALVQGIMDNLPTLIAEVPRIINEFSSAIYNNLPTILKAAIEIMLTIIKGLIQSIPTLVANIPAIIMAIVNVITLYNWWQLGTNVITNLGNGIKSMFGNMAGIGKNLANKPIQAIRDVFSGAPKIGKGLVEHLITGVKILAESLVTIVKNMGTKVISGIKSVFSPGALKSIGSNLVKGIWNGINDVTGWILSKIKGFGKSVMNGLKSIFGIKSPSTLMRDEIGKNLALGIGVGFEAETDGLNKDINKEMTTLAKSMQATVDFETASASARMATGFNGRVSTISNDDNSENNVIITGNEFHIREETDIERVAIELDRLRVRRARA